MSREPVTRARRVVVKLGSQVLTGPDGRLERRVFEDLAADVAQARARGVEVVVVSSGAVAAGMGRVGLSRRPEAIPEIQALAAVGQIHLVGVYEDVFRPHGIPVGQVLLTRDDLESRRRYQNAKTAISALLRLGAVPVINENDTVVVEELKFGDNDNLSALVSNLVEADALVVLSDIEGLYDRDPKAHADARLVERVERVDEAIQRFVGGSRSRMGTGGMATKLEAARKATHGGAAVVISSGKEPHALARILVGEPLGTFFAPQTDRLRRRKHWIAYTVQPAGRIRVDTGAVRALVEGGKSLLPKGVVTVDGEFDRGEAVVIEGPGGEEVARGLTAYGSEELRKIAGLASWEIVDRLGYTFGDEVIHRDDLVVFKAGG